MTAEEKKQRQREQVSKWQKEHRAERNEYSRKWYSENKERAKKRHYDYWKRKILADIEQEQTVKEGM